MYTEVLYWDRVGLLEATLSEEDIELLILNTSGLIETVKGFTKSEAVPDLFANLHPV